MSKSIRSCFSTVFIVAALGFVVVAGLFMALFVANRLRGIKTNQFEPPTIIITAPSGILELPAGDPTSINATATGQNPIARLELWADGTLVDTQVSEDVKVNKPFYGDFDYTVKEAPQILFVRAADTAGIVGQSQALGITGIPKQAQDGGTYFVPLEEGDTLEKVAEEFGADVPELQAANPGLAAQAPAAGAMVQVPIKPKTQPQGQQPAQPQGQQPGQPQGNPPGQQPAQPQGQAPALQQVPPPAQLGNLLPVLPTNPIFGLVNNVVPLAGNDFPPLAPTDFKVQVYNSCDIFMMWEDNATNEEHYEVWMATPYMQRLASLSPGPGTGKAWFKMTVPSYPKMVFWIEAVNKFGKGMSKLEVLINDEFCIKSSVVGIGSQYVFRLQGVKVNGSYDRFYCYFSAFTMPKTRMPTDDNTFILLKPNGYLLSYPIGKSEFIAPIPESGVLDLSGECLGWSGTSLVKLGPFTQQFKLGDLAQFNSLLEIKTANYEITFSAYPYDSAPNMMGLWWVYGYSDPNLEKPYNLRITASQETLSGDLYENYRKRLEWDWKGDESKISGFAILRDGVPHLNKPLPANSRAAEVTFSNPCGDHVRWEVAAMSENGMAMSAPLEYNQPKCDTNIIVHFTGVRFNEVYDDEDWPTPRGSGCKQQAEGYFSLTINGEVRPFYTGGNFFIPFRGCKTYDLDGLTKPYKTLYPEPTVFRVPWNDPKDTFWGMTLRAEFYDYDTYSGNDNLLRLYDSSVIIVKNVQDFKNQYSTGYTCTYLDDHTVDNDGDGYVEYCLELEEKPVGQ